MIFGVPKEDLPGEEISRSYRSSSRRLHAVFKSSIQSEAPGAAWFLKREASK
jgi:hypothetical protein